MPPATTAPAWQLLCRRPVRKGLSGRFVPLIRTRRYNRQRITTPATKGTFMLELTPDECRVLGVLIEKALTVPGQYPLSVNALAQGASQKNNRDPVTDYTEDRALAAVDHLRAKSLALEVHLTGSRVIKFRHTALDTLAIRVPEEAILAELLLRGPQTLGELRGRASRMHAFDSLEAVQAVLDQLMQRPEPLVQRLPPAPGTRAERFAQLLCPTLHPLDLPASSAGASASIASAPPPVSPPTDPNLADRVGKLEAQVAELRARLDQLPKP